MFCTLDPLASCEARECPNKAVIHAECGETVAKRSMELLRCPRRFWHHSGLKSTVGGSGNNGGKTRENSERKDLL